MSNVDKTTILVFIREEIKAAKKNKGAHEEYKAAHGNLRAIVKV